jgi:hypothetical protein
LTPSPVSNFVPDSGKMCGAISQCINRRVRGGFSPDSA